MKLLTVIILIQLSSTLAFGEMPAKKHKSHHRKPKFAQVIFTSKEVYMSGVSEEQSTPKAVRDAIVDRNNVSSDADREIASIEE